MIQYQANDSIDVANVDVAVAINIALCTTITRENHLDDDVDVADVDIAVTVDVTGKAAALFKLQGQARAVGLVLILRGE